MPGCPLLLLAVGCQAPAVVDQIEPADTGWLGGYVPADPEPVWSVDEALLAASEAIALGFPNPWHMSGVIGAWFSEGDALCPGTEALLSDGAIEGCKAVTQWYYIGVGGFRVEEGGEGDMWFVSAWLMGDMEILGPEGEELAIGGHWDQLVTGDRERETWEGSFSGSWYASPSYLTWLETGVSAWLWTSGERTRDTGEVQSARLHGALAYGETSLYFDELTWDTACGQPVGSVRVRDPSGGWFEKSFSSDCDPCGPVMFHGEQVAESACLDLAVLTTSMLESVRP